MICVFLYVSLEYLNSDLIADVNKSAVYIVFFNSQVNKPLSVLSHCSIAFHHIDTI